MRVLALLTGSDRGQCALEYHGLVTFEGLPVPGATVTVTQGGKKLVNVTDTQGFYSLSYVDGWSRYSRCGDDGLRWGQTRCDNCAGYCDG